MIAAITIKTTLPSYNMQHNNPSPFVYLKQNIFVAGCL